MLSSGVSFCCSYHKKKKSPQYQIPLESAEYLLPMSDKTAKSEVCMLGVGGDSKDLSLD